MEVAANGRISLSAAGQLRGTTRLVGRNSGLVKFCNGEMMGKKMKLTQVQQGSGGNKNVRRHVCKSVATVDALGESKVCYLKSQYTLKYVL